MKIKLLALAVTGVLLSGCGNDSNGDQATFSIQAYDPAIYKMDAVVSCTDGTTGTAVTDFSGNATFTQLTVVTAPETCSFTMIGGIASIDVSNSKSMNGVNYAFPKGLAKIDTPATISPLTTLITRELGDATYTEATATTVLTTLGLGSLFNSGISVSDLLLKTATVVQSLESDTSKLASFQLLASTTSVLTDILEHSSTTSTVAEIAAATVIVAENVKSAFTPNTANKVVITPAAVTTIVANPTQTAIDTLPTADVPNTDKGTKATNPDVVTGSGDTTGSSTPSVPTGA